jgi:hypothetical protein
MLERREPIGTHFVKLVHEPDAPYEICHSTPRSAAGAIRSKAAMAVIVAADVSLDRHQGETAHSFSMSAIIGCVKPRLAELGEVLNDAPIAYRST